MYTVLVISSIVLLASVSDGSTFLYWPAGVKSKLPSGAKVRRRKKDVSVSLAYIGAFRTPLRLGWVPVARLPMLGELGMTAGSGIEGAGEAERRIDGDEPNEDRRLCEVGGGFIGRASDWGVPGADGAGEPAAKADACATKDARPPKSGGAGLLDEILRAGKSIFVTLLCGSSVNSPFLFFRL